MELDEVSLEEDEKWVDEYGTESQRDRLQKKRNNKEIQGQYGFEGIDNGRLHDLEYLVDEGEYDENDDDWKYSDLVEEIHANYVKAISRHSSYIGRLKHHIASGYGVVYRPFSSDGDNSALVGQTFGDIFKISHFAPTSLRKGMELIKQAAEDPMPMVFAVPDYLANQLEKSGFRFITEIP